MLVLCVVFSVCRLLVVPFFLSLVYSASEGREKREIQEEDSLRSSCRNIGRIFPNKIIDARSDRNRRVLSIGSCFCDGISGRGSIEADRRLEVEAVEIESE